MAKRSARREERDRAEANASGNRFPGASDVDCSADLFILA